MTQIKRFIGTNISSDMDTELAKFSVKFLVPENQTSPHIQVQFGNETLDLLPEQILSMILDKAHQFALSHYQQQNKETTSDDIQLKYVFAVPPSFTASQLSSVKDSCKISGITEVEFVSDITAAIVNYVYFRGLDNFKDNGKKMMFLQMGHSYFTAQIVEIKGNDIKVLSTVSSDNLGARNFDFALFDYAKQEFMKKYGFDISTNPKSLNRVLKACEKCKQVLSTINETDLIVESLHNDKDLHIKINRQLFEELNEKSLKSIESYLSKIITESGISNLETELDGVEVFGGGIRIPSVQAKIKSTTKKDLQFGISAQAIALGSSLCGKLKDENFSFKLNFNDNFSTFDYNTKFNEDQIKSIQEKNLLFAEQEKLIASIHAKKNELESYIFAKKNQIKDSKYQSYLNSTQIDIIQKFLGTAEDWLHQSDVESLDPIDQLKSYSSQVEDLKNQVNNASPDLYQALLKEEEQRKKEMEEGRYILIIKFTILTSC